MRYVTFVSWLATVGIGAFMLRTWLARGGLRRVRARDGGLPPVLIFGHMVLAVTGLLLWIAYLGTSARPVAWAAVVMLMLTMGLGLSTVTLWTPYPAPKPGERRVPGRADVSLPTVPDTPAEVVDAQAAESREHAQGHPAGHVPGPGEPAGPQVTDEMIARLLEDPDPVPRPGPVRPNLAVLVPVAHGAGALATFLLALLSAIS